MKVLWLSHFLPHRPTGHGALQRTHNLLVEAARRHEVHVVALAVGEEVRTAESLRAAAEELRPRVASLEVFPLNRVRSKAGKAVTVLQSAVSPPSYWDRLFDHSDLRSHLRSSSRDYDIVHVDIVFLTPLLDFVQGVPVVLNHHNIESDLLVRRATGTTGVGRWYFQRQATMVARSEATWAHRAGTNLVVSELDGARLKSLAGDVDLTVVPNGVDVDFFQPTPNVAPQSAHMVFAGGMDWFPNRDAMVFLARSLWPALKTANSRRRMTVVGRNPPQELLQAASRDDSLKVTGFVDDVRPYMSAAPIYLCPITIGGGTRLKILDALSMSRALVSTDLGVEGLDLQEEVHYLRANTAQEFVAQVTRLENDPALVAKLGTAGREFVVQRYAWPAIATAMDEGWRRAADRG